ncbi:MAG: hypothetical protein AAGF90_15290, partial [Pseudomonadota bacterium]
MDRIGPCFGGLAPAVVDPILREVILVDAGSTDGVERAAEETGARLISVEGDFVARAAAGDWPVLVSGGSAEGALTADLDDEARARLDWYETAFGYVPEAVRVGDAAALVYREAEGGGGAGEPWNLAA